MAPAHRTIACLAAAVFVVTGGLAHGGAGRAGGPLAAWNGAGPATAPADAEPAPWLAAASTGVQDISRLEPTNDLMPSRLPNGWRQVARGVYAVAARPGDGPVMIVSSTFERLPDDHAALRRLAAVQQQRWAGIEALDTSVRAGEVFGSSTGIARSHEARRPLPVNGTRLRFSRIEVRVGRAGVDTFMAIGIDDASRPGSADEVASLVDSLRRR